MQVKLFPDTNSSKEPNWCIWKLCLNGARIKNQHTNRLAVCLLEYQKLSLPMALAQDASKTLFWMSAVAAVSGNCDAPVKLCSDKRNGSNPVEKDSNLSEHSLLWYHVSGTTAGLCIQKLLSACVLLQDVTPRSRLSCRGKYESFSQKTGSQCAFQKLC